MHVVMSRRFSFLASSVGVALVIYVDAPLIGTPVAHAKAGAVQFLAKWLGSWHLKYVTSSRFLLLTF